MDALAPPPTSLHVARKKDVDGRHEVAMTGARSLESNFGRLL